MSTLEQEPQEVDLRCVTVPGPVARLIQHREVPLGGPRGIIVTRTLPERTLPTIGAWCFIDQSGPTIHRSRLLPHPHIGLQTVTWLIQGEMLHRDTLGTEVLIRPGQLNLMTSGCGIAHSEFTPGDGQIPLHLFQLWVALPDRARHQAPHFEQHSELPELEGPGWTATVFMGALGGASSPAATCTPLIGAEVRIVPGQTARIPVDPRFEHGIVVGSGEVEIAGVRLERGPLLYLGTERTELVIEAGAIGATLILIGGEPLGEDLVMWWNFVARTHEEIVEARDDWEAHAERFGEIPYHRGARMPAPPLPTVRLTPRRRPPEP